MIKKIVPYNKSKLFLDNIKEFEEGESDFENKEEIEQYYRNDFFNNADQIFFKDKKNNKYYPVVIVIDKNNGEIIHGFGQNELDSLEYAEEHLNALKRNKKNIVNAINILLFGKEYSNIKEIDIYGIRGIRGTFPFGFEDLEEIKIAGQRGKKITYKNFDIIVLYKGGQGYNYNYNVYNII